MNKKNLSTKCYYPFCKEKGCNGFLNVKIRDNFTLEYECENNASHKRKNIYFKTFERFYLKEKEIGICSNCKAKLDNVSYKCIKCDKKYCALCFINDKHIKENINNLKLKTKKCRLHNKDLTQYCSDCKRSFCHFCVINDQNNDNKANHNSGHNIINLMELIPSINQINNLKNKIKQHSKFYEKIINSINQWERTLVNKSKILKQNLRNEINFLEKLFSNYNQFCLNYSYLSLFNHFDKYIDNKNKNVLLNNFIYTFNIEEQTKILFELFKISKKNEENIIQKKFNFQQYYQVEDGIFEKINNCCYFQYNIKKLYIIKYENDYSLTYCRNLCPVFNEKIYSVSISKENNQIYACLLNEKRVKILNYNLNSREIIISNQEIKDENNPPDHFNKCIYIGKNLFITADNELICLWKKRHNINIAKLYKFNISNKTSDLLLVNEDYFISAQPNNKTIIIFNIKNLRNINQEKIITNIDSIDSQDCLLKYKEFIIINCIKGIALLFIKTKEISHYIDNYIGISINKEIFLDINDNICILNKKEINNEHAFSILKLSMNYGSL